MEVDLVVGVEDKHEYFFYLVCTGFCGDLCL